MKKFLRRTWERYSKLGRKRKNKQKWRRPTGRDNKMREKRKGYPKVVKIGYKKSESIKEQEKIVLVKNLKDLRNIGKENKVALGKFGKKKKIEISKKASEMKISFENFNIKKFLKQNKKPVKTKTQNGSK